MGNSVHFDGNLGTFVDCGFFHAGDSVTVEAWAQLDSDARANINALVCRWQGSYELDFGNTDIPRFMVDNDSNIAGTASAAPAASRTIWHHLVGVFTTNGTVTVYVDGVRGGVTTIGGVLQNGGPTLDRVLIGATRDGATPAGANASWNLKGYIDEVAIYDHALTAASIRAHYRATMPPPEALTAQKGNVLVWSSFPGGYVLQQATDPNGPYQSYTGPIYRVGQTFNALAKAEFFYRLVKP